MYKVVRIAGGVLIGVTLCVAILFLWGDISHIWQWLEGTHEWFIPFDIEAWLWIMLFLGLGYGLVKSADRCENQRPVIPTALSINPLVRYFLQHLRGEHSLARSFWINTVLLFFAFYGAWDFFHTYSGRLGIEGDKAPVLHSLAFHFIPWLFAFLLITWQLGGVFRSAHRKIQTAPSLWSWIGARSVQVLVGVAFFMVIYAMLERGLPDIVGNGLMIPVETVTDAYTLSVLNAGTELEVRGRFNYGLTEDVKHYLEVNSGIRVIRLNSGGGRPAEGKQLHDLIQAHNLNTYSSIGCSSACARAFLGGAKRYLNTRARLGFHLGWNYWEPLSWFTDPGAADSDHVTARRDQKLQLLDAGVDPQYAEKLSSSLTLGMLYPPLEELLKAGVVHGLSESVNLSLP